MIRLNVGNFDRAVRVLAGGGLLAMAAFGVIGAWGYLGVVPLVTGVTAFCPLYRVLGIASSSR